MSKAYCSGGGILLTSMLSNAWKVSLPVTYFMNLWLGNEPTGVLQYSVATSRVVSTAVQKNGGNSTHPICNDNGIVGVYIVMVGTEYRPYLSWTDCKLRLKWIQ